MINRKLQIAFIFALTFAAAPITLAATTSSALDGDLVEAELGDDTEAPPPAEFPYPGARDRDLMAQTPATPLAPMTPRPVRIDDEDNYYYDTRPPEPPVPNRRDIVQPSATTSEGEFHYPVDNTPATFSGRAGVERPVEMTAAGQYTYGVETSPQSGAASLRVGFMPAPALKNAGTGLTFEQAYSKNTLPIVLFDYEWQLKTGLGKIGVKFGTGVYSAQGLGHFKNASTNRRPDDIPQERYTFLMFPNSLTAIYRFQYTDKQVFVPFIEGGAGYFGFTELRDDNIRPKIGGAAVAIAAGGMNFLLDGLDRRALRALDNDYGINHVWLTTEYRLLVGLNQNYDFTGGVFNAGVLFEF